MSLPGSFHSLASGESEELCETCNEQASIKMQGETDSFGCEWIYLCKEHEEVERTAVKEAREVAMVTLDDCDWCKQRKLDVRDFRDFEEGSNGPVYSVCKDCRVASIESAYED